MSILNEKDNCYLLSHETYLNQLYSDVHQQCFVINSNLFRINKPFKVKPNVQRRNEKNNRKRTHERQLEYLQDDIRFVEGKYNEFKSQLVDYFKEYTDPADENNQKAIATASGLYGASVVEETNFIGANPTPACTIQTFNGTEFLFPPKCKFYCKDLTEDVQIDEKFDVIVMDPPWWNKAVRRKNLKGAGNMEGYSMLHNEHIMKLPIGEWLQPNGVVFIWCTNAPSHITAVEKCLACWGLKQCAKWYWLKTTKSGQPITPFSHFPKKQPFEQIIIGSRNVHLWSEHTNKVIVSVPSALHSHKPPLSEVINRLHGDGSGEDMKCMELFARYLLSGWTSVGMEVLKFQNMCFYTNSVRA